MQSTLENQRHSSLDSSPIDKTSDLSLLTKVHLLTYFILSVPPSCKNFIVKFYSVLIGKHIAHFIRNLLCIMFLFLCMSVCHMCELVCMEDRRGFWTLLIWVVKANYEQ